MKTIRALFLLCLLAACGPVMKTQYEMVPPETKSGRICAADCEQTFKTCKAQCRAQAEYCDSQAKLYAQSDYMSYVYQQQREGRSIVRTERDFYRPYGCTNTGCEEACGERHQLCHGNCGGKVIPHSYCTAFCN